MTKADLFLDFFLILQRRIGSWLRIGLLVIAAFAGPIQQAYSQETKPAVEGETTETETPSEKRPEVRTLPPAYENLLLRLAESLGALHYLRNLCGAEEGQTWREEMERLILAEEPSEQRKAQLIANFNRGFRGYSEIYRECTQPAVEAANQFLQQATRLTAQIPNRFGR